MAFLVVHHDGTAEEIPDAVQQVDQGFKVGERIAAQIEIVTACAADQVVAVLKGAQPLGHGHQDLVPVIVAHGVVERLETVEIQRDHCDLFTGLASALHGVVEVFHEEMAIREPGQGVAAGNALKVGDGAHAPVSLLPEGSTGLFKGNIVAADAAAQYQRGGTQKAGREDERSPEIALAPGQRRARENQCQGDEPGTQVNNGGTGVSTEQRTQWQWQWHWGWPQGLRQ